MKCGSSMTGRGGGDQGKHTPDQRKTWATICFSNSSSPVLREGKRNYRKQLSTQGRISELEFLQDAG